MDAIDLGLLRGLGTAVLMLAFVALCVWAYSPARRARFDEAGRLPFADGDAPEGEPR